MASCCRLSTTRGIRIIVPNTKKPIITKPTTASPNPTSQGAPCHPNGIPGMSPRLLSKILWADGLPYNAGAQSRGGPAQVGSSGGAVY